jgi:hypothetical protein
MERADVLAMVEDQFTELRKQLDVQLVRMSQIQQQLDQIHTAVKQLIHAEATEMRAGVALEHPTDLKARARRGGNQQ